MRKTFVNIAEANGSDRGRSRPAAAVEGERDGHPDDDGRAGVAEERKAPLTRLWPWSAAVTGVGECSGLGASEYPGCWERALQADSPPLKALAFAGFVRGSSHFLPSTWPSANEKLPAPLWAQAG